MLCSGVAACHRYVVCTFHCVECTQHSKQYTHTRLKHVGASQSDF